MDHPNGTVPALLDDQLLVVAEQAERRIEAVKKIKSLALRVTSVFDWIDQNGRPYLQASGSEKVARLFGVSWAIEGGDRQDLEDGHFIFSYKGRFTISGVTIEAVGSRSSRDGFFSTRYEWDEKQNKKIPYDLPPSEIDQSDVKKAAYTNCIGNGITRLLGIRNMKWEEITEVTGFGKDDVTSIQYGRKPKKKTYGPAVKKANNGNNQAGLDIKVTCPPGGPEAGKEVSTKYCAKMCELAEKCDPYQETIAT